MGLLFFVKFSILDKKDDIKGSFTDSELANNMVDVLLKTTTRDCKGSSVSDLFQDCAGFKKINCDNDGEEDACDKVNETVNFIFSETLEKWRKSYEFKAYTSYEQIMEKKSYRECNKYSNRESKTYPIPTDRGTLFIQLDICS